MKHIPLIAVTMGDPGGVGPEITLRAIGGLRSKARYVLIGRYDVFARANKWLRRPLRMSVVRELSEIPRKQGSVVYIREISKSSDRVRPGRVSPGNGRLAFEALALGVTLAQADEVAALVTAPISKEAIHKSYPGFTDQTDYLSSRTAAKETAMAFTQGRKCITLVTTHLAIKHVPSRLKTQRIISKTALTAAFLAKAYGIRRPRMGILGLNPHAGENGLLGLEEKTIIAPAVRRLKRMGFSVSGPLPPDTAFYAWHKHEFDGLVAMYHDQGLGPFKMLYFHNGVHITLGLPFIRTAPDHGTAFNIAHRGVAREDAMRAALRAAIQYSAR